MKSNNSKITFAILSLLAVNLNSNTSAMEKPKGTPFVPFISKTDNEKTTTFVENTSPHTSRIAVHYKETNRYGAWQEKHKEDGKIETMALILRGSIEAKNAGNEEIFEYLKNLYEKQQKVK